MYSIASRIVVVGFFLYTLDVGCQPQPAAYAQNQPAEVFSKMPKAGTESEEVPAEQLPLPHELWSETVIADESSWFHPPTRINRYEVWQFYEVGRYGQFRPRVIYSAYGSFYLYDGRPYPWISTHQLDFILRVIGP